MLDLKKDKNFISDVGLAESNDFFHQVFYCEDRKGNKILVAVSKVKADGMNYLTSYHLVHIYNYDIFGDFTHMSSLFFGEKKNYYVEYAGAISVKRTKS